MESSLPGVGIFGTGFTATTAAYLLKSCGFRIEAIWGRTEDEAKEMAMKLNIPFYTNRVDELLLNQQVGLVCIYSPPFLQSEIAVKTLGIGKNVLCERPAGLNCEDTQRMLTAAKYYPSLISLITYYLRFLPTFCEMKKKIEDGFIGDLSIIEIRVHCGLSLSPSFNWSHDSRMGGGVLSLFGGHFIDLVTFLSGQKAEKVHGFVTTFRKQTETISGFREITSDDFCTFEMKLNKGAFCTCIINNNLPGRSSYEVQVIGTKASLLAKNGSLHGQVYQPGSVDTKSELFAKDDDTLPQGLENVFQASVLKQIPIAFTLGMMKFIECFKSAFSDVNEHRWNRSALKSAATFEDALYVQKVLSCIKRSSKSSYWEQV